MSIVYIHTNKINGKVYIGITSKKNPQKRWEYGYGYKSCPLFNRAIEKYGWNNFYHQIVYKDISFEEAKKKEIELIKQYHSNDKKHGYNILEGGSGALGRKVTKQQKDKMSKAIKLYYLNHPEHKQFLSNKASLRTGEKNPFYGKHHTIETKKSIANKQSKRKILCVETNIVYESTMDVERELGIYHSDISKLANGSIKGARKGLHFVYYEENKC